MKASPSTEHPDLLLRRARIVDIDDATATAEPPLSDVLLRKGRIAEVGPTGSVVADVEPVDLDGRYLIPGLWDHHVHFTEWTMVSGRLDLARCASAAEVAAAVAAALAGRTGKDRTRPLIGFGYRDALWPDHPHRRLLDAVTTEIPVCLVGGDLHGVWLNGRALDVLDLATVHPTGILRENDCVPAWAYAKANAPTGDGAAEQGATDRAASAAAARGVVGIVDFERAQNLTVWRQRFDAGHRTLRVRCGVWSEDLDAVIAAGHATGDPVPGTAGLITVGPFKIVIDGSLNTRTAYCHQPYPGAADQYPHGLLTVDVDELHEVLRRATAHGLTCAVHAIGDHANAIALDAFQATGARGAIEHAQMLSGTDIDRFAELGVVASIQPQHAVDDRDVADRHWSGRTHQAFPFADLVAASARLALGSDAPVAPLDPWISIAAAVRRTDGDRAPWHPEQRLAVRDALAGSVDPEQRIRPGADADLVVLDRDPLSDDPAELAAMPVWGTLLGGGWTWRVER